MKEDNPYYLGNRDNPPTQLVFEYSGVEITQELPWEVSYRDLCHAFYTCLASIFDSQQVLQVMYNFGTKKITQDTVWQCKSFKISSTCVLTARTGNSNISVKLKDHSTGIDLCRTFYTVCLSMTFISDSIYEMMADYAEEMMPKEKEEQDEQE